MSQKTKRPCWNRGADYFTAYSKLYGRHSPRQGGDCKGLRPASHFLALALAHIEAQQRREYRVAA